MAPSLSQWWQWLSAALHVTPLLPHPSITLLLTASHWNLLQMFGHSSHQIPLWAPLHRMHFYLWVAPVSCPVASHLICLQEKGFFYSLGSKSYQTIHLALHSSPVFQVIYNSSSLCVMDKCYQSLKVLLSTPSMWSVLKKLFLPSGFHPKYKHTQNNPAAESGSRKTKSTWGRKGWFKYYSKVIDGCWFGM